jgi:uncharacterized protein (UPF0335 family)
MILTPGRLNGSLIEGRDEDFNVPGIANHPRAAGSYRNAGSSLLQKRRYSVLDEQLTNEDTMSVLPFKEDEDFRKHNQHAEDSAKQGLRQIVEEYESLDAQVADFRRDQKDLMTVAKAKGWDTKALRRLLAERKRDAADLEEERQLVEQYRNLLL